VALNKYQKLGYKWFGKIAQSLDTTKKLGESLKTANMHVTEDVYMACAILTSLLVFISMFSFSLTLFIVLSLIKTSLSIGLIILLFLSPFVLAGISYAYYIMKPRFVSNNRARKIDMHLPYALNFIAAMSSAGVTPTQIFESLSRQDIYGEMKNEALLIYRDITLLGKDILSAMRDAMERTPSKTFKDFLQGAIVTVTSGGSLKSYFSTKAEQFMRENKQIQRKFNETLATMAECYVVAAVAGPLMILIIIPLMAFMSSGGGQTMLMMYFFVFLVLPIIHMGFIMIIKSMTPEV